jgi:hypothetical protein
MFPKSGNRFSEESMRKREKPRQASSNRRGATNSARLASDSEIMQLRRTIGEKEHRRS